MVLSLSSIIDACEYILLLIAINGLEFNWKHEIGSFSYHYDECFVLLCAQTEHAISESLHIGDIEFRCSIRQSLLLIIRYTLQMTECNHDDLQSTGETSFETVGIDWTDNLGKIGFSFINWMRSWFWDDILFYHQVIMLCCFLLNSMLTGSLSITCIQ